MSVYLYGFLTGDAQRTQGQLEAVSGLGGAPVEATRLHGVTVVHSPHDGGEILQTRRLMLSHTRVLEALMAHGAVLPMRFGLVAADWQEVSRLVEAAKDRIADALRRIDGLVEIGVRISWPRDAALRQLLEDTPRLAQARDALIGRGADAHFERIELGRQVAEALDRRRSDAQRRLAARLAPVCADHVLRAPEEDVEGLRMECLVRQGDEAILGEAADAAAIEVGFAGDVPPLVRIVGPVPPFNFVRLSLWQDEKAA